MNILMNGVPLSADIPNNAVETYKNNFHTITRGTGQLFLFSCDQKIEHLNQDFQRSTTNTAAQDPEHLFQIAQHGTVGAVAMHFGLIARYAHAYPHLNYIVKLNGRTNLLNTDIDDPLSTQLWTVDQVMTLQEAGITIRGIGITVYLGSTYEGTMLRQAAQAIYDAHRHGLIAIVWMYPRGKAITDDRIPELLAGAAGVATSLGADFVKIKSPHIQSPQDLTLLKMIVAAAGTTKVICSGESLIKPDQILRKVHDQINGGDTAGCAIGRNIFQRSLPESIAMTHALAALVFDQASIAKALATYEQTIEAQKLLVE